MNDAVIRVRGIGKLYEIGERSHGYKTLRESLVSAVRNPFRARAAKNNHNSNGSSAEALAKADTFWALKDINFDVHRGEIVGIIGRNGAGKSTLLKILSRITDPTEGEIEIEGRVGSLLEVGTGFHPELTGRENIFLNGAILGMKRAEIAARFDEIVAFAGTEKFLDTPVKYYSSGMYMRLAFAIAAHLEPEILIVDEVLAVGDAEFQKKCLGKIGDVARSGRTVLFVSHQMAAVASLCNRVILLDAGEIKAIGDCSEVIPKYLVSESDSAQIVNLRHHTGRVGTGEVRIVEAAIRDKNGDLRNRFNYGEDIFFELTLERVTRAPALSCTVEIQTATGVPVLHLYSMDDPSWEPVTVSDTQKIRCMLPHCDLYPGVYNVSMWAGASPQMHVDWVSNALQLRVEQGDLIHRGFDMNWKHAVVHKQSFWRAAEETSCLPCTENAHANTGFTRVE
ncbi:MAG TPA: ABC transporter ATP-binding protein [Candidatus Acidoferrales bacterium]|nr:ABC transporter ATP-binding protein [Candidatus Acidoferrales bacterium]